MLACTLAHWVTKLKSYLPSKNIQKRLIEHAWKCIFIRLINQPHRHIYSLLILEGRNTSTVVVKTSSLIFSEKYYLSGTTGLDVYSSPV